MVRLNLFAYQMLRIRLWKSVRYEGYKQNHKFLPFVDWQLNMSKLLLA